MSRVPLTRIQALLEQERWTVPELAAVAGCSCKAIRIALAKLQPQRVRLASHGQNGRPLNQYWLSAGDAP